MVVNYSDTYTVSYTGSSATSCQWLQSNVVFDPKQPVVTFEAPRKNDAMAWLDRRIDEMRVRL